MLMTATQREEGHSLDKHGTHTEDGLRSSGPQFRTSSLNWEVLVSRVNSRPDKQLELPGLHLAALGASEPSSSRRKGCSTGSGAGLIVNLTDS